MMELEILKKTRELLAKPENWIQKCLWGDGKGKGNYVEPTEAVCFCLDGAIDKVCQSIGETCLDEYEMKVVNLLGFKSLRELYDWNDVPDRTHQEVLDLLDQTIAKLE